MRVSQEPNTNNLDGLKTSYTTNNDSVFLSSDPKKPLYQGESCGEPVTEMHLNLSAVNAFDVYKKNKNLISSSRKKNLESVKDLHSARSAVKGKEDVNLSAS